MNTASSIRILPGDHVTVSDDGYEWDKHYGTVQAVNPTTDEVEVILTTAPGYPTVTLHYSVLIVDEHDAAQDIGPDGQRFPWGRIIAIHPFGRYSVLEYEPNQPSNVSDEEWASRANADGEHVNFHCYADGCSLGHSTSSLEKAILICICITHDEARQNTRAPGYIARMIGLEDDV